MPSQNLLHIPVEQIAVIDRARKDYGDLQELVDDMLTLDGGQPRGQLQPGIVRRVRPEDIKDFEVDPAKTPWVLVAGGRRFNAVCIAGIDTFSAVDRGDLPPLLQRIYELHENLLRKGLSWTEEIFLKAEIHNLRKQDRPDWTQTDTGKEVKESTANISRDLALVEEIKKNPALANAPNKLAAVQMVKQQRATETRNERIKNVPQDRLAKRIQTADMFEFVKTIPDDSVNLVFMDFPNGRLPYEFDPSEPRDYKTEQAIDTFSVMLPQLYRITKSTGWLALIVGHRVPAASIIHRLCVEHLEYGSPGRPCSSVLASAKECTYLQCEYPEWLLVHDQTQPEKNPDLHALNQYERIYIVNMGTGTLTARGKSNVFSYPVIDEDDRLHPLQLNHEFCKDVVQRLTVGGEKVVDLCCGSAATLAAAAELERDFLGCDIDAQFRLPALSWISEHMPK